MGGVHYTHISRYEKNQSSPSLEALKKLAKIFGVSTDYLLFDDIDKMTLGDIHDPELLHQFQELDRLDTDVRGKARFLLEAILTQQQVQQIAATSQGRDIKEVRRCNHKNCLTKYGHCHRKKLLWSKTLSSFFGTVTKKLF